MLCQGQFDLGDKIQSEVAPKSAIYYFFFK